MPQKLLVNPIAGGIRNLDRLLLDKHWPLRLTGLAVTFIGLGGVAELHALPASDSPPAIFGDAQFELTRVIAPQFDALRDGQGQRSLAAGVR